MAKIQHKDSPVGVKSAHPPGYVQSGDPGAVGAYKVWIDTTGGTGLWVKKIRNAANSGWETIGGGASALDDLSDVDTTGQTTGDVLTYDGADWVPQAPAGGGGAVSYLGYDTIGGSQEVMTNTRVYLKKITALSNGFIQEIEAYWKTDGANAASLIGVAVHSDAAGVVDQLVGMNMTPAQSVITEKNLATPVPRWLGTSVCKYVTAGDWWIGFMTSSTGMGSIYYDGSGTDNHYTPASIAAFADPGGTAFALTIGTRNYSIRAAFLSTA